MEVKGSGRGGGGEGRKEGRREGEGRNEGRKEGREKERERKVIAPLLNASNFGGIVGELEKSCKINCFI